MKVRIYNYKTFHVSSDHETDLYELVFNRVVRAAEAVEAAWGERQQPISETNPHIITSYATLDFQKLEAAGRELANAAGLYNDLYNEAARDFKR